MDIPATNPPALQPAIEAARQVLQTEVGRVNMYVSVPAQSGSEATPLLLIHSVNAAASAAEVAPLFRHYSGARPVVAMELPGYGFSERGDRIYTPRLMTDAIHAVLAHMAQTLGPAPVDVLALSLSSEFAARAAVEAPERIARLALVSPTGLLGLRRRTGAPGSTRYKARVHAVLRWKPWSQALFDTLTRPSVIRYFLRRTWGSDTIDPHLWPYCVQSARQEGARFAPLCFLSMAMFSQDVHTVYDALTCPVWASLATRGDFTDYRGLALLQNAHRWKVHRVPGGALPYFEDMPGFAARLDGFWKTPLVPVRAALAGSALAAL
ncbi:MAG: alpha/beta fold hydrolase [Betaproteobacteria bacterium]